MRLRDASHNFWKFYTTKPSRTQKTMEALFSIFSLSSFFEGHSEVNALGNVPPRLPVSGPEQATSFSHPMFQLYNN